MDSSLTPTGSVGSVAAGPAGRTEHQRLLPPGRKSLICEQAVAVGHGPAFG